MFTIRLILFSIFYFSPKFYLFIIIVVNVNLVFLSTQVSHKFITKFFYVLMFERYIILITVKSL
jgi:hypothetical protein